VSRQAGNAPNPEVIVYRDDPMTHSNFVGATNQYRDAAKVWEFFKGHPRIPL